MKILNIVPSVASSYGGPARVVAGLHVLFRGSGIESAIATTSDSKHEKAILRGRRCYAFRRRFPKSYFYSPILRLWLQKHLREYDLVHIHTLFSFPTAFAASLARRQGVPYLITPCGVLDRICLERHAWRKSMHMQLFDQRNLTHAAGIHCTAESEAEQVRRFPFCPETHVIPLGVIPNTDSGKELLWPPRFPEIPLGKKILVFLGRLHPIKGLDYLFDALLKLSKTRQDFILLVAGTGIPKHVERVKKIIKEKGIGSVLHVLGEVAGGEKKALLQRADLFVLPSRHENFGVAVVEAMAAGCPVAVSCYVAIHKEIAAYQAGRVFRLDPAEIAATMGTLLDDALLRKSMAENAKKLAREKFDLNVTVQRLTALYHSLIDRHRKGAAA